MNDGSGVETMYLLPSATAPGTYAIADAGITFGPRTDGLHLVSDGSDRLLLYGGTPAAEGDEGTEVHEASTVLAADPTTTTTSTTPAGVAPAARPVAAAAAFTG